MTFEAQRQQISIPVPAPPTSSILHIFERALRDVSLPIERAREIYNLQRENRIRSGRARIYPRAQFGGAGTRASCPRCQQPADQVTLRHACRK